MNAYNFILHPSTFSLMSLKPSKFFRFEATKCMLLDDTCLAVGNCCMKVCELYKSTCIYKVNLNEPRFEGNLSILCTCSD